MRKRFETKSVGELLFKCNPLYQPFRSGKIWHKVNFFKRSLIGLNSEFSFS